MHDAVVEVQRRDAPRGHPGVDLGGREVGWVRAQRGDVEAPGLAERLHVHAVRHDGREDLAEGLVDGGEDLGVVDNAGGARLRHEKPAGVQLALQHLVEALGVEHVRRTALHRVGEVQQDDVETLGGALQVRRGVVDLQVQPGVVKGALVVPLQVFAAQVDDLGVEVDHHGPLHGVVPKRFPGRGAFPAACDADRLRVRVRQHHRVHQALVVDELVRLRRLRLAVEDKAAAKAPVFEHLNGLVFAFPREHHALDAGQLDQVRRDALYVPFGGVA